MKFIKFLTPCIILFFALTGYSQNDTIVPKQEFKLGGSFMGLYLAGEKYLGKRVSIELIGTSCGIFNTLHLGPKFIIKKSKYSIWKIGLSGSFYNENFKERSDNNWGISLTPEFSRKKLFIFFQPVVLLTTYKTELTTIIWGLGYRWKS